MKVFFLKLNITRMGLWDADEVVTKMESWSTVWSSFMGLFDSCRLNQYYAILCRVASQLVRSLIGP